MLAGWTGAQIAVNVRVTDSGALDTLSIWDTANSTRVALTGTDLRLLADRTTGGARLAGTMCSTATVVITLGAVVTGSTRTATGASTMIWAPSTAATDLAGNASRAPRCSRPGPRTRTSDARLAPPQRARRRRA